MTPPAAQPLLQVQQLQLVLSTARGPVTALRDLSFSLPQGGTLGLIGESGSGKSLTALALMGLLPEGARLRGSIRLQGQELVGLDEAQLCRLRGRQMGMVFQEPMTALNPLHPIGRQVAEPLRLHQGLSAAAARAEALRLLERVQLPRAAERLSAYPHQLSGGQRQRVLIAIALACRPQLLIADEPTTALDTTTQREVLDLIQGLVRDEGMALLLVSHDLALMADRVQQLLVMYGGTVVDSGPTAQVFARAAHPYTRGLMAARPRLRVPAAADARTSAADAAAEAVPASAAATTPTATAAQHAPAASTARPRLPTIPGRVPELADMPPGCPFAARCPLAIDACRAALPPLLPVSPAPPGKAGEHLARCIRLDQTLHAPTAALPA